MYNNLDSQFNSTILNPEYNKYPICYMTKQCEENNKLWSRNEPLDDIQKKIVVGPRPGSTAKSNIYGFESKYKSQFPKKTENWIKPKDFNNLYCRQKFKRINDESFLLNINKKADKFYTLNTLDKIVKYPGDFKNNKFSKNYLDSKISPKFDPEFVFNESTRRKIIGACGNEEGRQWCEFDDYDKNYTQEKTYRFNL